MHGATRARAFGYWFLATALTVFGLVDLVAIGLPFLILGLTLLVVGRARHERRVFQPAIAAAVAFIVIGFLLVPLGCTSSAIGTTPGAAAAAGTTTCGNALGIEYAGPSPYTPPLLPALLAGATAAMLVWVMARRWMRTPSAA